MIFENKLLKIAQERNKEFEKLKKENNTIRDKIKRGLNTILKNKRTKKYWVSCLWEKINNLINNEIEMEKFCNQ